MGNAQPIIKSAVYIDDLLENYLPRAGRQKFEWIDLAALNQHARCALFQAVNKYGIRNLSKADLWDRIDRGDDHIWLLPDDSAVQSVAAASPDPVIYLNGVLHPKALLRKTYFHIVLREECGPENAQSRIKDAMAKAAAPSQRKSNGKGGISPVRNGAEEHCRTITDASVEKATEYALSKLSSKHARVIQLLLAGQGKKAVAAKTGMTLTNVYIIVANFRERFQKAFATLSNH